MKFYNKYFKNSYEELIRYYPRFYRNVFEMVEILKVYGKIADTLETNIEQVYFNNFVLTADTKTIKMWEKILGITYEKSLPLNQRKNVVIGRISGYGHIGEPEIRSIIANYTKNDVKIDFTMGVITIIIDGNVFDEMNLLNTLLCRIPAHLILNIKINVKRVFQQKFSLCYGTFFMSEVVEMKQGMKQVSTKGKDMKQDIYCHTHITSKLIGGNDNGF